MLNEIEGVSRKAGPHIRSLGKKRERLGTRNAMDTGRIVMKETGMAGNYILDGISEEIS